MASAWVAFARDLVNGLIDFGWPRYNSSGEFCVLFPLFFSFLGKSVLWEVNVLLTWRYFRGDALMGIRPRPGFWCPRLLSRGVPQWMVVFFLGRVLSTFKVVECDLCEGESEKDQYFNVYIVWTIPVRFLHY
jgi:hypothetical protein